MANEETPSQHALNVSSLSAGRTVDPPPGKLSHLHGAAQEKSGERFGEYELLDVLGRGGMGVVYLARQTNLNRMVALKRIRAGEFAAGDDIERFYAEARAAGALDHPGIVPIYEVGQLSGQPFFSMAFVRGESLQERLARGPLVPSEAARLVKGVAEAVEYAHSKAIVHRDLKPGNILIDEENQPRVTDFGLAKRIDSELGLTLTGQVLGTPAYMPPEQAQAHHQHVGPRSDVYALGAVLYATLAGRAPFQAASRDEIMRQVIHDDPLAVRKFNPSVPVDLETIALKCLEKEPARRYVSAQELAIDLGRFLNHEPVAARPISALARTIRWGRRKPISAGLIAVATALVLVLSIGGPVIAFREITHSTQLQTALQTANDQTKVAQRQVRVATAQRLAAEAKGTRTPFPVRSTLLALEAIGVTRNQGEPTEPAAEQALRASLDALGGQPIPGGGPTAFSSNGRWLVTGSLQDGTAYLWDLTSTAAGATPQKLSAHQRYISCLTITPDGKWLVLGSADKSATLWDLNSDLNAPAHVLQHSGRVEELAFTADSRWLISSANDGTVRHWDCSLPDPTQEVIPPRREAAIHLSLTPKRDRLITATAEKTLNVWNLDEIGGETPLRSIPHEHLPAPLTVSPDGDFVAVATAGITQVWNLANPDSDLPAKVFDRHEEGLGAGVKCLTFSPDGSLLVTGCMDGTAQIWDWLSDEEELEPVMLRGHEDAIECLAISPDGHWLVTGSFDKTVRVWDLTAPSLIAPTWILRGHENIIDSLTISPNGRWLVTASSDRTARIWDLSSPEPATQFHTLRGHTDSITALAFSPNGKVLASGSHDKTVRLWDYTSTEPSIDAMILRGHDSFVRCLKYSADGRWLATGSMDNTARVWDLHAADPAASALVLPGHEEWIEQLAFSRDARWLATGSVDHTARVWDLRSPTPGSSAKVLRGHTDNINCLGISADGRQVVTGSRDGTGRIWNMSLADPATQAVVLRGHDVKFQARTKIGRELQLNTNGTIECLAISPGEDWLATAGVEGSIRLWQLRAPDPTAGVKVLAGHQNCTCLLFTPDYRWLVSGGGDGTVRIWDPTADDPALSVRILESHESSVMGLATSADGRWLVSNSDDQACVWDLHALGSSPQKTLHADSFTFGVAISPDGRWVATAQRDNIIRVWDLNLDSLCALAQSRAGRTLTAKEAGLHGVGTSTLNSDMKSPVSFAGWQRPRVLHDNLQWHEQQLMLASQPVAESKLRSFTAEFHRSWADKIRRGGVRVHGFVP